MASARFSLQDLPGELLDQIFAPSSGLSAADYIAVAGTSKFFRQRFDTTVFKSICHHLHLESLPSTSDRDELRGRRSFFNIFTRYYDDTYTLAKLPGNYLLYNPSPEHYRPDEPRHQWTKSQYEIYKEEQMKWKICVKKENAVRASKEALIARKLRKEMGKWIDVGTTQTKVMPHHITRPVVDNSPSQGPKGNKKRLRPMGKMNPSKVKYPRYSDRVKTALESPEWIVPSPNDESDSEEYMPVEWDQTTGQKVIHDFWPNRWRTSASSVVSNDYISKSDVMKEYIMDEEQLMSLRHYCVPKPVSKRSRKEAKTECERYFRRAVVRALEIRYLGGASVHARLEGLIRHEARLKKENNTMKAKVRSNNGQLQTCEKIKRDLTGQAGI